MQENLRLTSFILQMGFFFNIVFVVKILANKVDISPKSTVSLALIGSFKGSFKSKGYFDQLDKYFVKSYRSFRTFLNVVKEQCPFTFISKNPKG